MPPTDPQATSPDALRQLLTERDAISRRLASLDSQIESTYAIRQQELDQRLRRIEETLHQWGPAVTGATPSAVPTAAGPVQASEPPPTTWVAPTSPPISGPTTNSGEARPRLLGPRVTTGQASFWSGSEPDSRNLGWVVAGTPVTLTDTAAGGRVRVLHQGEAVWIDAGALSLPSSQIRIDPKLSPADPEAPGTGAPLPAKPALSEGAPQPQPEATISPSAQDSPPAAAQLTADPPVPPPAPAKPPLWERPGFLARVLALSGAAVTLIGVGFLLVQAAQYGFFGPGVRTAAAAVLGVVLLVLAFVVRKRDERNVGAPILAATGIAAGFLSVVTATAIYHWLPPLVGAALTVVVGLGGMFLARRWDNQWVAIVSTLGGLGLAAWVGADELLATTGLMVLMTAVTLWFERGTGWRLFSFARVIPTVLVMLSLVAITTFDPGGADARWTVALAVALALLGLLSAVIAPPEPAAGQVIALGLLVPMVLPVAASPLLLPGYEPALPLGSVAVAFVVAGFAPKVDRRARWALVPIGALFTLLTIFNLTENRYFDVMTPAMGAVYLAIATRSRSRINLIVGGVLAGWGVFTWLPQLFVLFSLWPAIDTGPEQILQGLIGIAATVLATMVARRRTGQLKAGWFQAAWALGILLGSTTLVEAGTWIGGLANNQAAGYQTGQALVTSAWMVLGALFLQRALAVRQHEAIWLRLALVLFGLAVGKLFILDLSMLDAIARIGAFLAVGLLLLFVGTRYARAWEKAHGEDDPGEAPELVEEAASTAEPAVPGEDSGEPKAQPSAGELELEPSAADGPDEPELPPAGEEGEDQAAGA